MITNNIIFTKYSSWRFNFKKARDSYIWDDKNKRYIDFTSGWNVTNLGWNRREVIAAGVKKMKLNSYAPMWTLDESQKIYAEELTKALGHGLTVVARATGGMEAIEMALKTARVFTGKKKIVSFYEQFHGSSMNALSLGYRPEWISKITDPRSDIEHLDYPQLYKSEKTDKELLTVLENNLENILKKGDVAALITEVGIITGWGSTAIAPNGFIQLIRKITKKYNVLLIIDEVGTGFSRIGSLFGIHQFGIDPDILVLAKGISNGSAAMGAMATTAEIAEATYLGSNLQSTFGWNPVACAIASKVLALHQEEKTWKQAIEKGHYIKETLKKELKNNPFISDIRGMGLEIGLNFVTDMTTKKANTELLTNVVQKSFTRGLHLVCDLESNIQIMPPLTISRNNLETGLDILISTIQQESKK
ncbi:MAG: aspartate aminotransferase family protein [Microgenomates group bacterium]